MNWPACISSNGGSEISAVRVDGALEATRKGDLQPLIRTVMDFAAVAGQPWQQMFYQQQPSLIQKMISSLQKCNDALPKEVLDSMLNGFSVWI
jgi:hypothetical protein